MMPLTPFFDVSDISPVPYTQKAHKNAPQKRGAQSVENPVIIKSVPLSISSTPPETLSVPTRH